jgi:hypothetical protein
MITRPTSNDDQFSAALFWALRLLGMITDVSSKSIMFLSEDYDQYLIMGELSRRENKAIELLEADGRNKGN